jgi:hypothetical protein
MNKKKYTIKELVWFEAENGLILTKDIKPFAKTILSNYTIKVNDTTVFLFDIYNNTYPCNNIQDAKNKAQELWEQELLKILIPVTEIEIQVIKHMNQWINSKDEMQLAIERIYRDSYVFLKESEVIKEIKSFTNNLIAEANTSMSVSDYRKYFFNVIRNKLTKNTNKNNQTIQRNR